MALFGWYCLIFGWDCQPDILLGLPHILLGLSDVWFSHKFCRGTTGTNLRCWVHDWDVVGQCQPSSRRPPPEYIMAYSGQSGHPSQSGHPGRGVYFSKSYISAQTLKMALHENPGMHYSREVIFLRGSSNISYLKKAYFLHILHFESETH